MGKWSLSQAKLLVRQCVDSELIFHRINQLMSVDEASHTSVGSNHTVHLSALRWHHVNSQAVAKLDENSWFTWESVGHTHSWLDDLQGPFWRFNSKFLWFKVIAVNLAHSRECTWENFQGALRPGSSALYVRNGGLPMPRRKLPLGNFQQRNSCFWVPSFPKQSSQKLINTRSV